LTNALAVAAMILSFAFSAEFSFHHRSLGYSQRTAMTISFPFLFAKSLSS